MPEPYQHIIVARQDGYGVVRLNRPRVLNALNDDLMSELVEVLEALDHDPGCRCAVHRGNGGAFAAGADDAEMAKGEAIPFLLGDRFAKWDRLRKIHMPLIAAVSGFALGGGCELAMTCDMIVASETAQFGQPEINLGIIPGAGGTQRLTRAIGKARPMEMLLTGTPLPPQEPHPPPLLTRTAPADP